MNWEEQFIALKRWYYRIRGNDDIFGLRTNHQDDFYRAFFIFCFHLKDSLKHSGISGVEEFVDSNLYLKLAGDIANYSKHTKLTSTHTGDIETKAINRGYLINPIGPGPSYVVFGLEIQSDGNIYDAFGVAEKCMNAWYEFLTSKSLIIPEMIEENVYKNFIKWEPNN